MVIAVTSDLDWAPVPTIEYFLDILENYNAKITIFATHKFQNRNHEVGIHPNTVSTGKPFPEAISDILEIFPNAKGSRMHGLQIWSNLLLALPKFGISYDSSYYLPDQKIKPYKIFPNLVEIPIFWEDDLSMINDSLRINIKSLKEQENSEFLYVYNIHPIHVFMNTFDMEFYNSWKKYYQNPNELQSRKNCKVYGAENALTSILETIDSTKLVTLSQVAEQIS